MRSPKLKRQYATHLPVLAALCSVVRDGPIVELGGGYFSSPLLHWICFDRQRRLLTLETEEDTLRLLVNFNRGHHEIRRVDDWDAVDLSGPWSIAFVDHRPADRRGRDVERLADAADYIIVHDTDEKDEAKYHYKDALANFRYRYDYHRARPQTSVVSNKFDPNLILAPLLTGK